MLHTKPLTVKDLCVLVLIKDMDISKSMADIYLSLFNPIKNYGRVFNRIKYLSCQVIHTSDAYHCNHTKIWVNPDDDLSLQTALNIQNAIIFIAPIFDNNYNHYQTDMFFLKCSYKLAE